MSDEHRTRQDETMSGKVIFRTLPVTEPPAPPTGGRLVTPAGEIAQVLNGSGFRYLAYLEFKPDSARPRGNHYHARKTESLYVISGRLRLVYQDISAGQRAERVMITGDLVTISPGCAHVYFAEEYSQAVEVSDTDYDPSDTIPFVIEESGT